MREVARIDSGQLLEYCKGSAQAAQIQETALTATMAIQVLLRDDPSTNYTPVGGGGNRFFSMDDRDSLPQGAVVGKGFFQSLRPTNLGYPGINLDSAYTAFVKEGPLIDVAKRILGLDGGGGGGGRGGRGGRGVSAGRGGRGGFAGGGGGPPLIQLYPGQISTLKKILKGAKFTVSHRSADRSTSTRDESQADKISRLGPHPPRRNPLQEYTLLSITLEPASKIKFRNAEGREMTVSGPRKRPSTDFPPH